jgi:hypothetical protein
MDENQENTQSVVVEETPAEKTPEVGFPVSQPKAKGKSSKWIFIVLALLIVGGAAIFIFGRNKGSGEELVIPTTEPTMQATATPTATLSPTEKGKVSIEIQNGTGITGEAAYLQGVLKTLGYSNIKVGNATTEDNTTTVVTFASTLSAQAVSEITAKLESVYKSVETKTSTTAKTDVVVLTGLKKGATTKPSATATPKASVSPTPKVSASPSASPVVTPTATGSI